MRITHNKVGQNLNLRDSGKAEGGKEAGKTGKAGALATGDVLESLGNNKADGAADASRVQVSQRAQDMKRAKEIATSSADVNEARVAELQKLIDAGKYKVDAKDIADKMVDEQMAWNE